MHLGAIPKTRKNPQTEAMSGVKSGEEDRMEVDGDGSCSSYLATSTTSTTTIEHLPDEVLEHIFGLVSPYSDLENCALTCTRWESCCRRVAVSQRQHFHTQLGVAGLVWTHLSSNQESSAGSISKRYSHCAVYYPKRCSMFVFGGCTSTSSTFNDLWELNLSTRSWHRPLSVGAYPSPKACASLVLHKDNLLLFGGWTHPSLYPLHQSWKLFSELHIYSIPDNRWELVGADPGVRPPAMAGHSATVHGNSMVVFGGLHKQRTIGHYTSSNDVWTFDLDTHTWLLQLIGGEASPLPRYGQSQIYLDPDHLLVMGGCGGPNNEYTDIWLLDMSRVPWKWTQMEVRGAEFRAKDIWSHPACRVGDKVVVLGKGKREDPGQSAQSSVSQNSWNVIPQLRRGVNRGQGAIRRSSAPAPHHSRVPATSSSAPAPHHSRAPSTPPHHSRALTTPRAPDLSSSDSDLELAVEPINSQSRQEMLSQAPPRPPPCYRTTLSVNISASPSPSPSPASPGPPSCPPSGLPPSNPASAPNALIPVKVSPAHSKSFGPLANTGNQDPSLPSPKVIRPPSPGPGAPGNPESSRQVQGGKNRQKMLENRQRQLASLQKMEEKIRAGSVSSQSGSNTGRSVAGTGGGTASCPHHRMATHILDIQHAVSGGWLEWLQMPPHLTVSAPQESILYSLVLGRTELVMFGGLQKDVSLGTSPRGGAATQHSQETVSNCLHFLNPPPHTI